ncbi:hypothetical protein TREES_T100006831 [Tupaia chinensis]|uniref:Uncharacterized protein n=1 Tax=Tupaia chinensis TaxID=246437 RepID=L9JE13_TUPCH|nr:hypothetical protein TREES_T100006831 [Tupaia chinensis]
MSRVCLLCPPPRQSQCKARRTKEMSQGPGFGEGFEDWYNLLIELALSRTWFPVLSGICGHLVAARVSSCVMCRLPALTYEVAATLPSLLELVLLCWAGAGSQHRPTRRQPLFLACWSWSRSASELVLPGGLWHGRGITRLGIKDLDWT